MSGRCWGDRPGGGAPLPNAGRSSCNPGPTDSEDPARTPQPRTCPLMRLRGGGLGGPQPAVSGVMHDAHVQIKQRARHIGPREQPSGYGGRPLAGSRCGQVGTGVEKVKERMGLVERCTGGSAAGS